MYILRSLAKSAVLELGLSARKGHTRIQVSSLLTSPVFGGRWFSTESVAEPTETVDICFVDKDGQDVVVKAPIGKSLLEVAHENDIELEGACEGSLACSTCHVIVEDAEYYKRMPEPTEDELDMLDLAFGLTETSRLGCQVIAAKELDGLRVRLPTATRNFYVDGHVPKPH